MKNDLNKNAKLSNKSTNYKSIYRVHNKKPGSRKIFIKNSFFNLFKQNFTYSLLTYSTSFMVIS